MLEHYIALKNRLEEERGQTMAEYGVILALITVVVIAALTALGGGITETLQGVADAL